VSCIVHLHARMELNFLVIITSLLHLQVTIMISCLRFLDVVSENSTPGPPIFSSFSFVPNPLLLLFERSLPSFMQMACRSFTLHYSIFCVTNRRAFSHHAQYSHFIIFRIPIKQHIITQNIII